MKKIALVMCLACSCPGSRAVDVPAPQSRISDDLARAKLEVEEATWYDTHPGGEVWPGPEKLDPVDGQ